MCIVAFESAHQSAGDGVGGFRGERWRRIQIFYGGLQIIFSKCVILISWGEGLRKHLDTQPVPVKVLQRPTSVIPTPRYLSAQSDCAGNVVEPLVFDVDITLAMAGHNFW